MESGQGDRSHPIEAPSPVGGLLPHSSATGPLLSGGCGSGGSIDINTEPSPNRPAIDFGRGLASDDSLLRDAIGADSAEILPCLWPRY